jgi:molybdenum cofactor synthesis domain-containing protein
VTDKPELAGLKCVIVTISDSVSQGRAEDRSGPALVSAVEAAGGQVVSRLLCRDDMDSIAQLFRETAQQDGVDLIVSTGGTGAGPRDVTPEALSAVSDKILPGFGEMMRNEGSKSTPRAILSRSSCGVLGGRLILCLPGSTRGALESLEIVKGLLPHALQISRGAGH